jgi:hypothetical protein
LLRDGSPALLSGSNPDLRVTGLLERRAAF